MYSYVKWCDLAFKDYSNIS